jgi:hypothetical protein
LGKSRCFWLIIWNTWTNTKSLKESIFVFWLRLTGWPDRI